MLRPLPYPWSHRRTTCSSAVVPRDRAPAVVRRRERDLICALPEVTAGCVGADGTVLGITTAEAGEAGLHRSCSSPSPCTYTTSRS